MAKNKTQYVCNSCGYKTVKWLGSCPKCNEFNTFIEETIEKEVKGAAARQGYAGNSGNRKLTLLCDVDMDENNKQYKFSSTIKEFDLVLGGGLVVGGTILLAGRPGAGKSTILAQCACNISQEHKVIYFSGEENLQQIKNRAERLGLPMNKLLISNSNNLHIIEADIKREQPRLVIVDSIASIYHPDVESEPGGSRQLKDCTAYLNALAKSEGVTIILVGHIVKNDDIAGPMVLMHIVDTVLELSSTEDSRFRIMRSPKNRFGSTSEVGIFEMNNNGIHGVDNPSMIFLNKNLEDVPGNVVTPFWEGSRTILVEVQALMDKSISIPRRVSVGIDDKRIAMLYAIINKHTGLQVHDQDIYVNIAGGVKAIDTSPDLSVILAATSSFKNKKIPRDTIVFGEVGLSGEVRACAYSNERLKEAIKLGFKKAIIPASNFPREDIGDIHITPITKLEELMDYLDNLD